MRPRTSQDYETAVVVQRAAEATVDAAKAQVQQAEIDLGYTRVLAPESGLAGKTEVYPGTLVGRGQSEILTHISQVETIHVRFTIPERDYLYYARKREEHQISGRPVDLPFELVLADGSVYPQPGEFAFADRQVDASTGTLEVAILFPNPGNVLRPGQYAKVRAAMSMIPGAVVIPQRAVSEMQGRFQVAVVGADNKVAVRAIKPGVKTGSLIVVAEGKRPLPGEPANRLFPSAGEKRVERQPDRPQPAKPQSTEQQPARPQPAQQQPERSQRRAEPQAPGSPRSGTDGGGQRGGGRN